MTELETTEIMKSKTQTVTNGTKYSRMDSSNSMNSINSMNSSKICGKRPF